jgi:hypothetical protein
MRAERYWEQRWRDEEARNAKLVAALGAVRVIAVVCADLNIQKIVDEALAQQSTEKP